MAEALARGEGRRGKAIARRSDCRTGATDQVEKMDSVDATRIHTKPRHRENLAGDMVPRDGIEPPTRGFSRQGETAGFVEGNGGSREALSGSCAVSGTGPAASVEGQETNPDAALKDAIKVAIDAGLYDRAARLLDVLRATPSVASVIALAARKHRDRG